MSTPTDLAASIQDVAAKFRAAAARPQDQIRTLIALANFDPMATMPPPVTGDPIGQAAYQAAKASADLCRRAVLMELCRACAAYQPASADDAVALRNRVTALLSAEITVLGDAGLDATYRQFIALRAAMMMDLTTRGARLASLMVVTTPLPMPATWLAQRLYRDGSRAAELTAAAQPVHPAFMPVQFKALAR
jgi:prophage DNA circulation protein